MTLEGRLHFDDHLYCRACGRRLPSSEFCVTTGPIQALLTTCSECREAGSESPTPGAAPD
jgi:hypothetical protein